METLHIKHNAHIFPSPRHNDTPNTSRPHFNKLATAKWAASIFPIPTKQSGEFNFIVSDPYVKVYLLCQNKRIKKKKTSVKKSTLCPVYNEALVFDVPSENIEDVSMIVKVIDYDR